MRTTIRNSAFMSIALFALLSVATVTRANDDQKDKSVAGIEFKFLGKRDHQSLFQLQINVPQNEEYIVRFRDNMGYLLYVTTVKKNFSQKYAIDTEEIDSTVTVEVRSKSTKKIQTFTISRNQTVLDETVIAKN